MSAPNADPGSYDTDAAARYYRNLLETESLTEAAEMGPEPLFSSLEEAAAVQPDIRAIVEDDEVSMSPVVGDRVQEIWKKLGTDSCAAGLLGENKPTGRNIPL